MKNLEKREKSANVSSSKCVEPSSTSSKRTHLHSKIAKKYSKKTKRTPSTINLSDTFPKQL